MSVDRSSGRQGQMRPATPTSERKRRAPNAFAPSSSARSEVAQVPVVASSWHTLAAETEPSETSGERRRSWSRSTERAGTILSLFSLEEPRLKAATVSGRLDLHPSTVYRYLEALEAAHLVERDQHTAAYKLGLRIVELSAVVLRDLDVRRHSLDDMDTLRDRLGTLVNLGVLRDGDVVHVAHAFPPGWPRDDMVIGRTAAAHGTALGKVLLASLAWEDALARVNGSGWRQYTPHTIHDEATLKAELDEVRACGYALDREENHLGIMCVAVAVRSGDGEVCAALSVTARSQNILERVEELASQLSDVSRRVSARMGSPYDPTSYL